MNRYDEIYDFRKARVDEAQKVADFMDMHWRKNCILSDPSFLEYEFKGTDDTLNIILVLRKSNQEIEGLLCYYPYSQKEEGMDIAGGPWRVLQKKENLPFLGHEMVKRAKDIIRYRYQLGLGLHPEVHLYHKRYLKYMVGDLDHFYLLNDIDTFRIAEISRIPSRDKTVIDERYKCVLIKNIDEIPEAFWKKADPQSVPYKDKWYIDKRFFQHVIFHYDVYAITEEQQVLALAVFRTVAAEGSCAVRWVDYIGDKTCIQYMNIFLMKYLKDQAAEYVDFYGYGFPEDYFIKAGFCKLDDDDPNIIPNYFEPFVRANIQIPFGTPVSDCTLCKGDSNMDSPNLLRKNGEVINWIPGDDADVEV